MWQEMQTVKISVVYCNLFVMKISLLFAIALLCGIHAFSQNNSFGLIKYNIPASWQEQIKDNSKTYSGTEPETNAWVEIIVHEPQPASPKPDSSFRLVWKNLVAPKTVSALPPVKKIYSESGLPVAYNVAYGAEVKENSITVFEQLLIITIDKQVQPVEIRAASAKELKSLRTFIDSFIGSLDTIVKRKD